MKKYFGLIILAAILVSCGDNENQSAFGKLQSDHTILKAEPSEFFSSKSNYKCENEDKCNENIVLISVKTKNKEYSCTGALISPTEIYTLGSCFKNKITELNKDCNEKIEAKTINGTVATCKSVEQVYSNDGDSIIKVSLDTSLNNNHFTSTGHTITSNRQLIKMNEISKENGDFIQKQKQCSITNLIINSKTGSDKNTQYIDLDCKASEGGFVIKDNNLLSIVTSSKKVTSKTLNFSCLAKCSTFTNKENKVRMILKNSENRFHKLFNSFLDKRQIDTQDYKIKNVHMVLKNNMIVAEKNLDCLKVKHSFNVGTPLLKYKLELNGEININEKLIMGAQNFVASYQSQHPAKPALSAPGLSYSSYFYKLNLNEGNIRIRDEFHNVPDRSMLTLLPQCL